MANSMLRHGRSIETKSIEQPWSGHCEGKVPRLLHAAKEHNATSKFRSILQQNSCNEVFQARSRGIAAKYMAQRKHPNCRRMMCDASSA